MNAQPNNDDSDFLLDFKEAKLSVAKIKLVFA